MSKLKVLVLAGGPDRERDVSLESGKTVAAALAQAGHEVRTRDVLPTDLSALDEFAAWRGDAIFPALHGGWGEGGGLQTILDARRIPYVGCRAAAADLCMDKIRTKQLLQREDLPTLAFEVIARGHRPTIPVPHVIKGPREGSSIDVVICKEPAQSDAAVADLFTRHPTLLVEQYCLGLEITVGVLEQEPNVSQPSWAANIPAPSPRPEGEAPGGWGEGAASPDPQKPGANTIAIPAAHALPPIRIVPAAGSYDYNAKYNRDDTKYLLDAEAMGLSPREVEGLGVLAVEVFSVCGCRHMSRIDFIVDENHSPWVLEVNTIPGFTSHSLLPKAAQHAGIELPALVDRLVRLALRDG